jgi:hypothetical protein
MACRLHFCKVGCVSDVIPGSFAASKLEAISLDLGRDLHQLVSAPCGRTEKGAEGLGRYFFVENPEQFLKFDSLAFRDVCFFDAVDHFNAAVHAYDNEVVLVFPNDFKVGIAAIVPNYLFIGFLAVLFVNHITNVLSIELEILACEVNKVFLVHIVVMITVRVA